ncbi:MULTISPECIES: VOC family protein [unclassified Ensifer]|uniref:VOC family protein n=1 Tax=unclassified Ensifer TaxID=2633371 RepID=UPI0008136938|nr:MULTISPECIES: VOC family protein [unclassified Ensifer]OCP07560.1 glyoxalase [Ensifer sp. LC11]OCP07666.1 glyoxalase [Ensifer sp. LC14]OCP08335.1 glyoxalase [Ensifer sp. LC13]OCP32055.1 glyoxalase [Ensifer sp. LC499]
MPEGGEDAARGFYGGLLGLTEVAKPANLLVRGGCWFEQGGIRLHLGIERDFVPARKAHPAFLADDLDRLILRLEAGGVEIAYDEPLAGYFRCYVSDPFGNRIELMQRTE